MFRKSIICLSLIGLFSGCHKELPLKTTDDPVFQTGFTLDGQSYNLAAGVAGYSLVPSVYKDSAGVNVSKVALDPVSCSSCGWSVAFLFRAKSSLSPDTVFAVGSRLFKGYQTAPTFYQLAVSPVRTLTSSNELFDWKITCDGITTPVTNYSTSLVVPAKRNANVILTYDDNSGTCSSSLTRTFRIGSPLQIGIQASRTSNTSSPEYSFSCQPFDPANKYHWSFGDGTTSDNWKNVHTFANSGNPYVVQLQTIDSKGDTCYSHYQVPGNLSSSCEANFNATLTPLDNGLVKGSVTILLIDPSGKVYSTENGDQPADAYFFIDDQKPYTFNGESDKYRQLTIRFNCQLSDGQKSMMVRNGTAVIAAAYR